MKFNFEFLKYLIVYQKKKTFLFILFLDLMVEASYQIPNNSTFTIFLNIPAKESIGEISEISPSQSNLPISLQKQIDNFLPFLKKNIDPEFENFLTYIKQTQRIEPKNGESIHKPIPLFNQKWLSDMALEPELECMSILYAKSVLSPALKSDEKPEGCRIHIG